MVLGRTGRNFAAGMSGGVAYVLDADGDVRAALQSRDGRSRDARSTDEDLDFVQVAIMKHVTFTEQSLRRRAARGLRACCAASSR